MQLLLILGIVFAIGAVTFALQNNVPVTVTIGAWHYDSSLAVVLLVALALGALIAGLVSTPSVIKGQWAGADCGARSQSWRATEHPWNAAYMNSNQRCHRNPLYLYRRRRKPLPTSG